MQLLAERMHTAKEIGRYKKADHIRDGKREMEIMHRLHKLALEVDCPPDLLKAIYPEIFDFSIQLQLKNKGAQDSEQVM